MANDTQAKPYDGSGGVLNRSPTMAAADVKQALAEVPNDHLVSFADDGLLVYQAAGAASYQRFNWSTATWTPLNPPGDRLIR